MELHTIKVVKKTVTNPIREKLNDAFNMYKLHKDVGSEASNFWAKECLRLLGLLNAK